MVVRYVTKAAETLNLAQYNIDHKINFRTDIFCQIPNQLYKQPGGRPRSTQLSLCLLAFQVSGVENKKWLTNMLCLKFLIDI